MLSCEEEWDQFCVEDIREFNSNDNDENLSLDNRNTHIPKSSDIYISTKTNISYLNKPIDLNKFWDIPILSYTSPKEGVIKKQMKLNFDSKEQVEAFEKKIKNEKIYNEKIISQVDNTSGNTKFKDTRKISIGLCKKDILSYRCKEKSAFYNCFVLIFRIKMNNVFRESHVKIFNTGKIEMPGIQSDEMLFYILSKVVDLLNSECNLSVDFIKEKTETVLINSNFNCGYFIDRDKLYNILKFKYNLHTSYDPCSYPGIMCKFYYDPGLDIQTGIASNTTNEQVSFMVFRTGSILIVGKCNESTLYKTYYFIKDILEAEYNMVGYPLDPQYEIDKKNKTKKKKSRRRLIVV